MVLLAVVAVYPFGGIVIVGQVEHTFAFSTAHISLLSLSSPLPLQQRGKR